MNTLPINVYNLIILDESGSMYSIYRQALDGINETINGIRQTQEKYPEQKHFVSIVTFEGDGMAGVKVRRDAVPVCSLENFTEKDYCPGGCTPLYDAIGKGIKEIEQKAGKGDSVLVTIITDGLENSSREFSGKAVKEMIAKMREKGWTFAYLGANQDAVEVAKDLNIRNSLSWDATPSGSIDMMCKVTDAQARFAENLHFKMNRCAGAAKIYKEMTNLFDELSKEPEDREG